MDGWRSKEWRLICEPLIVMMSKVAQIQEEEKEKEKKQEHKNKVAKTEREAERGKERQRDLSQSWMMLSCCVRASNWPLNVEYWRVLLWCTRCIWFLIGIQDLFLFHIIVISRRRSIAMSTTNYPYPLSSVTLSIGTTILFLRFYGGSRDDEIDETDANDLMAHGSWLMAHGWWRGRWEELECARVAERQRGRVALRPHELIYSKRSRRSHKVPGKGKPPHHESQPTSRYFRRYTNIYLHHSPIRNVWSYWTFIFFAHPLHLSTSDDSR